MAKSRVQIIVRVTVTVTAMVMVLTLLMFAATRPAKPPTDTDPIRHAIQSVNELTDLGSEVQIHNWIFTLVLSGKAEDADAFAKHLLSASWRFRAYLLIAEAQQKAGKIDKAAQALQNAKSTVMEINPHEQQLAALAKLAAITGDSEMAFDKVKAIPEAISNEALRADTLLYIGMTFIKSKNFDVAITAADKIELNLQHFELLVNIAQALFEDNQPARAKATALEAVNFIKQNMSGWEDKIRFSPSVLIKVGLANELLEELRTFQQKEHYVPEETFEMIAVGLAETGETEKALEVARSIPDTKMDERAFALASVSQALRQTGQIDQAELILTEAMNTALSIENKYERSEALDKIAPILVKAGRTDEVLKAIRALDSADNKSFASTAVAIAESGNMDEANTLAIEVFNNPYIYIPRNVYVIFHSGFLLELVKMNMKAGRKDDALKLIKLSQQKMAELEKQDRQSIIRRCGDMMLSTINRFIPHFPEHEQEYHNSYLYQIIAETLATAQQWDQAIATTETCYQDTDRFEAYTTIVREYSIAHNPALATAFDDQ